MMHKSGVMMHKDSVMMHKDSVMMHKMLAGIVLASVMSCGIAAPSDAPLSFNLSGVPVVSFLQATYKSVLGRDYVIAPEVLGMEKRFSISVRDLKASAAPAFVDDLLLAQGIQSVKRGDIYYLTAAGIAPVVASVTVPVTPSSPDLLQAADGKPAPVDFPIKKVHVYQPANRPVEFMVAVINAAYAQVMSSVSGIGGDAVALLGYLWFDKAISVLFSAVAVSLSMRAIGGSVKKMIFK